MRWISILLVLSLLAGSVAMGAGRAAAQAYLLEVQAGGPGTVTPGTVQVPAGGSQTFTFTPTGCNAVADVTVDDVSLGSGLTQYTFTNVQSDHVLYVTFGPQPTTTTLEVRPFVGQCAVPETLTATVANADGGQVRFFLGATPLDPDTPHWLVGGVATYIVTLGLNAGSYSFSANYLGTTCSSSSSSPAVPYDVGDPDATVTIALSPGNVVPSHSSVLAGATLRIGGATTSTPGQMTFYDGPTVLGTVAMTGGSSSTTIPPMSTTPGAHAITAQAYLSACLATVTSAPETLFVQPVVTLTLTPPQVNVNDSVLMTAVLNTTQARGRIHFLDVTSTLIEVGTDSLVNGTASILYGPFHDGLSRTLQAHYDGSGVYPGCTSNPVFLQVGPPPPPPPPQFSGALFSVPMLFDTWPDAYSVAIADFNADGRPDLATANWNTKMVSVLQGFGDGRFVVHNDFGSNGEEPRLAVADLNGDGRLDLAVTNSFYNPNIPARLSVLLGNGNGTFGFPADYLTGTAGQGVAIADFNADGRPDLSATTSTGVSVLLGNGDGTFRAGSANNTPHPATSVAIGDVNGDARPDFVVADIPLVPRPGYPGQSTYGGEVTVFAGNGNGTFNLGGSFNTETPGNIGLYGDPISLALGDLNGDGRLDVVTANRGEHYDGVTASVLLGNGDGTFGPVTLFLTADTPQSVAIADLDGDGRRDLAVECGAGVSVLLGNGDGTFQPYTNYGSGGYSVAIADLSADGKPDLALAGGPGSSKVAVLLNTRAGPAVSAPVSASIGETALNLLAPNPTPNSAQIHYTVARAGHVRLEVADVSGRVVSTLFDGVQQPGRFQLAWDGRNRGQRLPAGLYFVRLMTSDRTVTRKITKLP